MSHRLGLRGCTPGVVSGSRRGVSSAADHLRRPEGVPMGHRSDRRHTSELVGERMRRQLGCNPLEVSRGSADALSFGAASGVVSGSWRGVSSVADHLRRREGVPMRRCSGCVDASGEALRGSATASWLGSARTLRASCRGPGAASARRRATKASRGEPTSSFGAARAHFGPRGEVRTDVVAPRRPLSR